MSLLLCHNPLTSVSSFASSSSSFSCHPLSSPATLALNGVSVRRHHSKPIDLKMKFGNGFGFRVPITGSRRGVMIVKASEDGNGTGEAPAESESLTVDKLPLESKLQQMSEQKLRMKLAKKIRLRRKRLLRKRKLRKKGRWPPSKMKKLKNV